LAIGNRKAGADLVVNGTVLVKDVPATYLIYLEKQLTDVRTFVDKMPTLDESENWIKDPNSDLFKTAVTSTSRTKKTNRALVLYPATDNHPAQTQIVSEDVLAGYWDTVKLSGALPVPRKREILDRVDTLLKSVKSAREQANEIEVSSLDVGSALFSFLFA
jgi:hypothetical protein